MQLLSNTDSVWKYTWLKNDSNPTTYSKSSEKTAADQISTEIAMKDWVSTEELIRAMKEKQWRRKGAT